MRLTNTSSCSACFTQDNSKRHVDLDADCDRGFTTYGNGNKIQMDDLILCSMCLAEAARLIGMQSEEKVTEVEERADKAYDERDYMKRERDQAQNYSDRLEDAFEHRANPVRLDRRQKPRKLRTEDE